MKILCVDIGTGTQDIFLYDSRLDIENGFKLVLPSPTMMMHQRIKAATAARLPILLSGQQMGGGPSAWAAAQHARAGLTVYATPDAAVTLDDELEKVSALGVQIVSEDEAAALAPDVVKLEFKDFDFTAISAVFSGFGVDLNDLEAVAVAAFDHGAAPPGASDRQFRFDYLDRRIRERNSLSAFACLGSDVPFSMSRLSAVAEAGHGLDCPLVVMDTAPAAILGATYDPVVRRLGRSIIVNIGNFHTLAFRLTSNRIEGLFEHHTGEIDLPKLELLLRALAAGTLKHEDVFADMGHGALIYAKDPLELGGGDFDVVVTGPRRALFSHPTGARVAVENSARGWLRPYFAVPFGDMMIAGCFGLLAATAEVLPTMADAIHGSMQALGGGRPPWELD